MSEDRISKTAMALLTQLEIPKHSAGRKKSPDSVRAITSDFELLHEVAVEDIEEVTELELKDREIDMIVGRKVT